MFTPPPSPRDRPALDRLTWTRVLVSYAVIAAIPFALWVVSRPMAGAVALASLAGLVVGARRVHALHQCFRDCRGFAFDLAGRVRVTITPPADDAACPHC
ncbi:MULTISPECIES: hypothetical protein [Halorussus]|uniref:hypothetical protein n=1 Tax=Halorussus TaxID=1070314 RepID=UPI0013B38089|nr:MULTISPECIES: hypothetical protein [Halorussus]NHN61207.1 hypothetical protein [Halorussus sp. JP-T4]